MSNTAVSDALAATDHALDRLASEPVITSLSDLDAALGKLSRLKAGIDQITAEMNAQIAAVQTRYQKKLLPKQEEFGTLERVVTAFALANEAALLQGQKGSTATRPAGKLAFREGRASVQIDIEECDAVAALRDAGFGEYVRTAETVDKAALLLWPGASDVLDAIPGIAIVRPARTVAVKLNAAA
ncbi:MAG: host-nuclease inhibitor Gam family protein [Rhodothermales bacterium]|nr:host-nuclease inhibitor Gam family protein [Rhodothermales bacterium]